MTIFDFTISMDIVCAAISMIGSLLVARYDRWSYLGWLCWLAANVLWIVWAFTTPAAPVWGVVAQNAFFFWTSIKGYLACRKAMRADGATAANAVATALS
ncbi:hypothetical protein LJR290_007713 [Variovorax sp. LjRoot290]|uniref:hypothetical protein n=1 Tax=unclassified Variovorax TaxID=663243 RepID=UPI003ECE1798